MKNRIPSAGAKADSEQKSEVPTSCPNNGNTHVVCIKSQNCKCEYCKQADIDDNLFVSFIIYFLFASVVLNIIQFYCKT